jgi:ribosomal protein S18 acetylase RimI-like enzyme
MARLVLRPATPEDIPIISDVDVSSATRSETEGFTSPELGNLSSPDALAKAWAKGSKMKDGSEVAVAEKNGRVVGFIVFKKEPDHFYIDTIDVTGDEQRKGIGKALVTYVERIALANGCFKMKTDTTESAEGVPWKSYGFWTKMGYKDTGERLPTEWTFKTIPFTKNLK